MANRPMSDYYRLGEVRRQHNRRFGVEAVKYQIDFQNLDKVNNFFTFIPEVFNNILQRIMGEGHEKDKIGIEIYHPDIFGHPAYIPFKARKDLDVEDILQTIELVSQSKHGLKLDETMYFKITIVDYTVTELHSTVM